MADPVLQLNDLHKNFGGLVVTDGVTLDIGPGELHAVIGPNGAGKTTLINQISGLLAPTAGTISFNGIDVTGLPVDKRAKLGLARSFQITSVLPRFSASPVSICCTHRRSRGSRSRRSQFYSQHRLG